MADALRAGQSVAYDGHTFARKERERLRAIARDCGVPSTLIVVATPEHIARERRLANRRELRRHDVPDDLFARAVALLEEPGADEAPLRYDDTEAVAAWIARLP